MRTVEKLAYKACKAYQDKHIRLSKCYRFVMRIVFSCDFRPEITLGKKVQFIHNGLGCVFHPKTIIGDRCKIYQNVTLGGNGKIIDGMTIKGGPVLQENVAVFSGVYVLGPITIGRDSIIGANAVIYQRRTS